MNREEERLVNDMSKLLRGRLRTLLSDTCITMDHAEMDHEIILKIVMAALLHELVRTNVVLEVTEKGFMDICRTGYEVMAPDMVKYYTTKTREMEEDE